METSKNRALSDFYREEFLRHLQYLETSGLNRAEGGARLDKVCRRFIADLDSVCWRADFPRLAETLLQNFDALTRLSELDPRQSH